jgi:hypothetical protein
MEYVLKCMIFIQHILSNQSICKKELINIISQLVTPTVKKKLMGFASHSLGTSVTFFLH